MKPGSRARRGQALVEFALIVPLFVLIVMGIFEGGRAIYTYNALSNATEEALREAIVNQDPVAIKAEADRVLGGLATQTTFTLDVAGCPVARRLARQQPCVYRVELRHQFTPILIGQIFSPVIAADGEMLVESFNP
jgi:Flp pilus assembly protein TadG